MHGAYFITHSYLVTPQLLQQINWRKYYLFLVLSIYIGTYNLAIRGYITISYHYLMVTSGTYARGTSSCTYQWPFVPVNFISWFIQHFERLLDIS